MRLPRQLYGDVGYTRIGVDHLADDEVFAKAVTGLEVTGMGKLHGMGAR